MTTHTAAADALLGALLAEASEWACDDAEDQRVLDAIDAADTPSDKLALLQDSTLVPSGLRDAVSEALTALAPATYAPPPRGEYDTSFLALATVKVHTTGATIAEARVRVEAAAGGEIDPAVPCPAGVRVSALTIAPGTVRPEPGSDGADSAAGAPAALLPPAIRASLTGIVSRLWEEQERDFAGQTHNGRARHIFNDLRQLRAYLDEPTA